MKTHPALILSFILCSSLASAKVQVGFSPDGSAERLVLNTLSQATVSIDLAAYAFTSKQVATVLLAAKRRGVSVRVLADKQSASDRYSAVTFLANQGVSVRLNGRYAIQHSKFALIDGETVQTGSLNYTHSAFTRNAENVVVIRGERAVSQAYQQEFERLWAEGEDLKPSY
ncbi:endonuclease [Yersinia pseudotuberculosis]|uniref:phospholipase D n=3 Tax=Yersinia TaxID=629 RepID=A0A0T9JW73_YERPU|nr:endonuclease [Yersinia pseudotuberculosis]CND40788.1 putative phospholipase D [Yersinia pseudotuberculosis]SUQ39482.1 putative phospholipase D [Yersinia pseudotuberculosis]